MKDFSYGFKTKLENVFFEDAIRRVTNALKEEGFGILTEMDVKATLKKKLDIDFRRYTILGTCNPSLAYKALLSESDIGLLLPCNVVVQEWTEGSIEVSIADPIAMFALVYNPEVGSIAMDVSQRLRRVLADI